jgi:hypothetical protein
VLSEIEALVCVATFDVPGHGRIEEPWYGDREHCRLPAANTPLQRAVERAYADARPALIAIRQDEPALLAALKIEDEAARLAAIRAEYLDQRFFGMLLPRLFAALFAEGLACDGCPEAVRPGPRTIDWSVLVPYVAAYVWPDPVVTPRGADGEPSGPPQYSMHICAGLNGVAEMSAPDPDLLIAAFLATIHTDAVHESAKQTFFAMREDPEFTRLTTDEARTAWLRERLGPRVAGDPSILPAVCETLARFHEDTGIAVRECAAKR